MWWMPSASAPTDTIWCPFETRQLPLLGPSSGAAVHRFAQTLCESIMYSNTSSIKIRMESQQLGPSSDSLPSCLLLLLLLL